MLTGGNFSQRYSDGSRVSGVLCTTELQVGQHRWRQVVGAATELSDGLDAARGGVLALSPASESSFDPLMASLPAAHRRLSLCARTGWLALGGGCAAAAASAAATDVPVMRVASSLRHWKLPVSGLRLALLDEAPSWAGRRRGYTRAPPLRLRGETAATTHEAQIDSGTTHIAVAQHGQRGRLDGGTAGHHGLLGLHLKAWDRPPHSGEDTQRLRPHAQRLRPHREAVVLEPRGTKVTRFAAFDHHSGVPPLPLTI